MGVRTAIPIEEYLHTSFDGTDREYRDGEVVERSMPTFSHAECQGMLFGFFIPLKKRLSLYPGTEPRLRLPNNRVLIPDVAVFHPSRPPEVPDFPPLIAIEVLSPDDRLNEVTKKLEEYRAWGVPHVWLVNTESRRFYRYEEKLNEVDAFRIPELDIELKPTDIFDSYPN